MLHAPEPWTTKPQWFWNSNEEMKRHRNLFSVPYGVGRDPFRYSPHIHFNSAGPKACQCLSSLFFYPNLIWGKGWLVVHKERNSLTSSKRKTKGAIWLDLRDNSYRILLVLQSKYHCSFHKNHKKLFFSDLRADLSWAKSSIFFIFTYMASYTKLCNVNPNNLVCVNTNLSKER